MNPKYPIYIISKGRWKSRYTSKALERMNVPYFIVVEKQEKDKYTEFIDSNKILILPKIYQKEYETFDPKGDAEGMSKGSGAARNFCWAHSIKNGFNWHWLMDDNIDHFYRLNNNLIVRVASGTIFRVMELFVERYENIAQAGPNYEKFAVRKNKLPPFVLNTRLYSCMLIRNDIPFRWRGRYNEDTDLSLRILKEGWCTIQFNAFLQGKIMTQVLSGGNTEEIYGQGTLLKSKWIEKMHPDVAKVSWKFSRWHHEVNYKRFMYNKLIKKNNLKIRRGVNNFGMELIKIKGEIK